MPAKVSSRRELKNIGYELFIGAISILSIVNLFLIFILRDPAIETVVYTINAVMMPIFLGDFVYRLATADDRSRYFWRGFGWADLLSSMPLAQLRLLRLFRLWRVIRLMREFGLRNLGREFINRRAENALLTVGFLVLCVLEFGALAVLGAERSSSNANITDASGALWWAYVTITTVGYGDRFPVTNTGRIIGVLVMTAGVGLFGTLSGFLAQSFLSPSKGDAADTAESTAESTASDPKTRITELMQMIETQEQALIELKGKLAEIKNAL